MKKFWLVALLVVFTLIVTPTIVQADPWSALGGSGYAVTTEPFPLEDVLVNVDEVTAKAGTTDDNVQYVVFRWLAPDGTVPHTDTVEYPDFDWEYDPTYEMDVKIARSTFIPTMVDDWGVQVFFYGEGGHLRGEAIIRIRATSFLVVPEVPIGTLTILLTMLASLAIFARKRF